MICFAFCAVDLAVLAVISFFQRFNEWESRQIVRDLPQGQKANSFNSENRQFYDSLAVIGESSSDRGTLKKESFLTVQISNVTLQRILL